MHEEGYDGKGRVDVGWGLFTRAPIWEHMDSSIEKAGIFME